MYPQKTYSFTEILENGITKFLNLNLAQQLVLLVGGAAVLAKLAPKTNNFNYIQPLAKPLPRKYFTDSTKRYTKFKQGFVCNSCRLRPKHWEYHHIDGNHSNNSPSNCEGLCLDCHADKHRKN